MTNLGETVQRRRAHPLGRRIGRDQLRMLLFEILQFPQQAIVLAVADLRIIEHIVTVVVIIDFVPQAGDAISVVGHGVGVF